MKEKVAEGAATLKPETVIGVERVSAVPTMTGIEEFLVANWPRAKPLLCAATLVPHIPNPPNSDWGCRQSKNKCDQHLHKCRLLLFDSVAIEATEDLLRFKILVDDHDR